jgi:hypothetical protein
MSFRAIQHGWQGQQSSSFGNFRRQRKADRPKLIDAGLVLHYDFGNGRCWNGVSTTCTDLSSTGETGTLVNSPSYNGSNGGTLDFDGTNDYLSTPSNVAFPSGSTARTICFWMNNPTGSWVQNANVFYFTGIQSNGLAFGIDFDTYPNLQIFTWGGGGNDLTLATTRLPESGWKNLCVSYDGNTKLTLWENGVRGNSGNFGSVRNTSANTIFVGTMQPSFADYYLGLMGQFALYNRELSDAEIWQNFASNRARYGI